MNIIQKGLAVAVIILFLVSPIASTIPIYSKQIEIEDNSKFIKFNSLIDLHYNASLLNDPIPLDYSTHIPMNLNYWTSIPDNFLWFIPRIIRNLILYFRFIKPMQKICLQVLDIPEGVDVYLTTPEILVDIPFQPDRIEATTCMVITPSKNALSIRHSLLLNASCDDIGRIQGINCITTVGFTPEYYLSIQISAPQYTICPRNQTTTIPINITNYGNWQTRVMGEIVEYPEGFVITLNPPFIDIEISETEQFLLEIYPFSFIGKKVIPLKFTASRQPLWYGSAMGNYSYYVIIEVI